MTYPETSAVEVDEKLVAAQEAYQYMKKRSIKDRVKLMQAIAQAIESAGPELVKTAMEESFLPEARLTGEKARTVFQWRSYAAALENGACLAVRIDTAVPDKTPPKPDLRKMMIGLGPVAVFGASNFPFAFSTAGGDTASAIAAGCPVILKAHPGHPRTSTMMADIIARTLMEENWPSGVFSHIYGYSNESGAYLVNHPNVKAVAFTGSYQGGKALFDLANRRPEPIPVFSEMGSINPVFALPNKLNSDPEGAASQYLASLTLGVGQFCTNPGVLIAYQGEALLRFKEALATAISDIAPANMLHQGIAKAFSTNKEKMLAQQGVAVLATAKEVGQEGQGAAIVAQVDADTLLAHDHLLEEVFGPFGLIVACKDRQDLLAVAQKLKGQLTITLTADEGDVTDHVDLVNILQDKCGRLLFNGMPTGVEVCTAMQHGGPFPATTDSRFTSVGSDAIKRFLRPLCFQNWPDRLLPDELKDSNPLGIYRMVNDVLTRDGI